MIFGFLFEKLSDSLQIITNFTGFERFPTKAIKPWIWEFWLKK